MFTMSRLSLSPALEINLATNFSGALSTPQNAISTPKNEVIPHEATTVPDL